MNVTIAIDTTNLFYRSIFTAAGYGAGVSQYTYDSQYECDQLMRKFCLDLSYIIRQIKPSNVIFCYDNYSWRKDFYPEYKGTRQQDDKYNWKNIKAVLSDFKEIAKKNNFGAFNIKHAEADDQIALLSEKYLCDNEKGFMIIISADEDVRQLIKSSGGTHIMAYNPIRYGKATKKLYISPEANTWYNQLSFSGAIGGVFKGFEVDTDKQVLSAILSNTETVISETVGEDIKLRKVFCGDDGDNIPSFMTWVKKEGSKPINITEKRYLSKITEELNVSKLSEMLNEEKVSKLSEILTRFKGSELDFSVNDRMERQRKLVELSSEMLPSDIVDEFNDIYKDVVDSSKIITTEVSLHTILDGTKYINDSISDMSEISIVKSGNKTSFFNDFN